MESVNNCTNCRHHHGKQSIDDVPNDCYPCVWAESSLGYYPGWQPIEEYTNELGKALRKKLIEASEKQDNVNHPNHYKTGGIETIDYIKAKLGVEGTINYCMGNVMKYTSRWQDKNGLEDLEKADWYLDYAITLMKEKNAHQ